MAPKHWDPGTHCEHGFSVIADPIMNSHWPIPLTVKGFDVVFTLIVLDHVSSQSAFLIAVVEACPKFI